MCFRGRASFVKLSNMGTFSFFLLHILLFLQGTEGRRFRELCEIPNSFRCDDGTCVRKELWCDRIKRPYFYDDFDCPDESDESHCDIKDCDDDIHFPCASNDMCIPIEGYCDGYKSCPDDSDERNCPCVKLHEDQGSIQHTFILGGWRTEHKCWEIVADAGKHVEVKILAALFSRNCSLGHIDVIPVTSSRQEKNADLSSRICSSQTDKRVFTFEGNIKIRYISSWYISEEFTDSFDITYLKVDPECQLDEAFRCTPDSCVLPEEKCDGKKDCENGLDEQNCDFVEFLAAYRKNNRINATRWLKSQRDSDWGWRDNTAKAVVALGLDDALVTTENDDDLTAKQLELEVSTILLRNEEEPITSAVLSAYINALLVICHDPRNFYGFDLILKLREEIEKIPEPGLPLPYLTLCSAKDNISEADVDRLFQILQTSTTSVGFVLEVQALALMALSCVSSRDQYAHLKQNITEYVNELKKEQKEDGSFGNEYTTALVLQALIANNQSNDKDWNFQSSIEFLLRNQRADGSYGGFLTTYLVMPILNVKSLVDVGAVNCTENLRRPREGSLVTDIRSRLGGKMPVKYLLLIGDDRHQIHTIVLRTPKNVTVLELMTLAADTDPKCKFKTHEIRKKSYVYEVSNIPNDPESNKFWFIFRNTGNMTVLISTQSPGEIRVAENEDIILWYKTLHNM